MRKSSAWPPAGRALLVCLLAGLVVASPSLARSGWKTVSYHGLELRVPARWPVFRVGPHTTTCVRFNRHAVYLGRAGRGQACPASGLGHTEAIQAQPVSAAVGSAALGSSQLVIERHGLLISATWAGHRSLIERALSLPGLPPATSHNGVTVGPAAAGALTHSGRLSRAAAGASLLTGPAFDTCAAPSAAQLGAARHSRYRGMGVYIGGINAACAQPNLSTSWVHSVTGAGWHLLLIYVGLQAPGNSCGCSAVSPTQAAAQGRAAADDAASRVADLGVNPGSPIYFDMEGYSESPGRRAAVLRFLAAWTAEIHHDGFRSGVYSGGTSGITDLVSSYGSSYREPDDLWVADWDGRATAVTPYVPASEWANHLVHQYLGDHSVRIAGIQMGIDSDWADAAAVGPVGPPTPWPPPLPSTPPTVPTPPTPPLPG